jgi:hypothetical protein
MKDWFEELPNECPPKEAFEPNRMIVYRLTVKTEPEESDLLSQRALKPNRKFKGVDECISRSLSVYNKVDKCWKMVKLPTFKNRWKSVVEIELKSDDGLVMKTFKDPNHYSWWRSTKFTIDNTKILLDE